VSSRTTVVQERIVAAAAELFTTIGYTATSTTMIAAAVGLRQPSLYYYFPTKESILSRLLGYSWRPGLDCARALRAHADRPADARLFALLTVDVESLRRLPWSLGALYYLPDAHADAFADLWRERDELRAEYAAMVREGARDGLLRLADPDFGADLVFRVTESIAQTHGEDHARTPERYATDTAEYCLRLLAARDPGGARVGGFALRESLKAT
jgi:AcrR family transcriptional regulator